jgi:putative PIN family toxin of toxin-antitoxin system
VTTGVAVIDTNVVVSGPLTRDRDAPTAVILDAMVAGRFAFMLSLDLIAEYREVLLRPRIRRRHGLGEAEVDAFLTELAANARVREPAPSVVRPRDTGDSHLFALLDTDRTAVLVTGDDALVTDAPDPDRVLSPRIFSAHLTRRTP